jgi:hypothetical protein
VSRAPALLLAALAVLLPGTASACAVCFDPNAESQGAFVATTILLSVLPLAILFGVGLWLRRKLLDTERRHESARRHAASVASRP